MNNQSIFKVGHPLRSLCLAKLIQSHLYIHLAINCCSSKLAQ